MACPSVPAWRIRILGAAAGAGASLVLALLTFITLVGLIIGLVGVPVGAAVGALFGPTLAESRLRWRTVFAAGLLAAVLGAIAWSAVSALGQSRGASLQDLVAYTGAMAAGVLGLSLTLGLAMSMTAAAIATWWLRRAIPHADRNVVPAAAVVAIVLAATVFVVVDAARDPGDLAALVGDQVHLEYVVRGEHPARPGEPGLLLDVRSYWKGEMSGGSSGAIDDCSSGTDWIQSSDWAIWVSPDDGSWQDRPEGEPLVSHQDVTDRPVRLTIHVHASGTASWEPGLQQDGC